MLMSCAVLVIRIRVSRDPVLVHVGWLIRGDNLEERYTLDILRSMRKYQRLIIHSEASGAFERR